MAGDIASCDCFEEARDVENKTMKCSSGGYEMSRFKEYRSNAVEAFA